MKKENRKRQNTYKPQTSKKVPVKQTVSWTKTHETAAKKKTPSQNKSWKNQGGAKPRDIYTIPDIAETAHLDAMGRFFARADGRTVKHYGQTYSVKNGGVKWIFIILILFFILSNGRSLINAVNEIREEASYYFDDMSRFERYLGRESSKDNSKNNSKNNSKSTSKGDSKETGTAAARISKIEKALNKCCTAVSGDDPSEQAGDMYSVWGNIRSEADDWSTSILVYTDGDGVADSVWYNMDMDLSKSLKENLNHAEADFKKLNAALSKAGIDAKDEVLSVCGFPEDFREDFLDGDGTKSVFLNGDSEKVNAYYSFDTYTGEGSEESEHRISSLTISISAIS